MPSNKIHKCPKCDKTYKEKRDLIAHTLNCEFGIIKSFYCQKCKNGYTFRSSLNKHKKKCMQSEEDVVEHKHSPAHSSYAEKNARKAISELKNYFNKYYPDNNIAQKAISDLISCFKPINSQERC